MGRAGNWQSVPCFGPSAGDRWALQSHSRETTRVPLRLRAAPRIIPTRRSSAGIAAQGCCESDGSAPAQGRQRQRCRDPRTRVSQGLAFPGAGAQHRGGSGSCCSGVPGLRSRHSNPHPRDGTCDMPSCEPAAMCAPCPPPSLPRTCRGWGRSGSRTHLGTGGDRVRRARRKL